MMRRWTVWWFIYFCVGSKWESRVPLCPVCWAQIVVKSVEWPAVCFLCCSRAQSSLQAADTTSSTCWQETYTKCWCFLLKLFSFPLVYLLLIVLLGVSNTRHILLGCLTPWTLYQLTLGIFFLIGTNVLLGSITNMSIAKHFWIIHSWIHLNDPLGGFLLHLSNTVESFYGVPRACKPAAGILTTVKTMYLPFTGHLSLLCLSANHLNHLDSFLDSTYTFLTCSSTTEKPVSL